MPVASPTVEADLGWAERLRLQFRFRTWAPLRLGAHESYYFSHAQFGEDMVLRSILGNAPSGLYVDVGAHHPVFYSNTYHFYRRGWRGINLDAMPGSMAPFRALRPRDVNLEVCLSPRSGDDVDFYIFDSRAHNTFDPTTADRLRRTGEARLVETVRLRTVTLDECLERYAPERIDFLTIDVEGMDEEILRSLDWARYRPRAVVFEAHDAPAASLGEVPLVRFFASLGYDVVGKCGPSLIVRDMSQDDASAR